MKISDGLLMEFDMEMANTRKVLERAPEDKFGWRPHAKSFTFGQLATHLVGILEWAITTLTLDMYNMVGNYSAPSVATSSAELLARFDEQVAKVRTLIAETSDETFVQSWTFQVEGKTMFTMPKIAVMRMFVMNHTIHHRGQFTVYLRLNDIPLPAIYGPTADEGIM